MRCIKQLNKNEHGNDFFYSWPFGIYYVTVFFLYNNMYIQRLVGKMAIPIRFQYLQITIFVQH
jgi:hypothetical protein